MPTPSIQTLVTDAQQVLNLDSISAVRSVVAVALANANTGTPLNPNLTTQQLWNEFYQVVTKPKSDIESIIANQLMKFLFAPPAPGGVGADKQVIFNDGGVLAGDPQFLWDKTTNLLTVTGSATITGDLTVDTSTLKVDSTNNRVGIGTATPAVDLHIQAAGSASAEVRLASATRSYNIGSTGSGYGSANNLIIYDLTGAAERYRLDASGNHFWNNVGGVAGTAMTLNSTGLGVGVSPTKKLEIAGTASATVEIAKIGATSGPYVGIGTEGTNYSWIQAFGGKPLQINPQGNDTILNPSSGNVGIGVTPSAWGGGRKAIQIGSPANIVSASLTFEVGSNWWNDGTNYKYTSNNPVSLYAASNGLHAWYNAPTGTAGNNITFTQAMTLAANGQLLLGTSTTTGSVDIGMVLNKPSATGFVGNVYQLNGVEKAFTYISSSAGAFRVDTVTGYTINMVSATNGVYLANGGTSWTALSDERFKDIIEPISNAVAKVGSIRSVIGKFKTESEGTRRSFLIAQDVQAVLPEAVDASNPEKLGVSYTEVIPLLVAAIKELAAEVNALKNA